MKKKRKRKTGTKEHGSKIGEKYNRINVRGLEKKFTKTETVARDIFLIIYLYIHLHNFNI